MKVSMKKWVYLVVSITILSCEDKGEYTDEVLAAQSALTRNSSETQENVIEMVNSTGVEALLDLLDLYDFSEAEYLYSVRKLETKNISSEITKLANAFTPNVSSDNQIDFGVYEWSQTEQDFILIERDVDYLEVKFPALGSTTNNSIFTISKIELVESTEEVSTFLFREIESELIVDGVLVVSLNLNLEYNDMLSVDYADINLYLAPFDHNLKFIDNEDKQTRLIVSVHRDEDKLMSVDVDVLYEDLDKYFIEKLEGEIAINDLLISGSVDIATLDVIEDTQDVNDYFSLEISHEGNLLGEVLIDGIEDDLDFLVVYEDGSTDSLYDLFEESIDEIEDILIDIELVSSDEN